jgi:monofunctional chorismate mutase
MSGDTDIETIEQYREEIDEIDSEMLRMLNRRAACAISIGKIKKRNDLPIHVPEREEQVLQRLISLNEGPMAAQSVRNVFGIIFAQMRALEVVVEDTP